MGQVAGQRWKVLAPAERAPYEALSKASKAEYARLSRLSPVQRIMSAAAAAMQVGAWTSGILKRHGSFMTHTNALLLPI